MKRLGLAIAVVVTCSGLSVRAQDAACPMYASAPGPVEIRFGEDSTAKMAGYRNASFELGKTTGSIPYAELVGKTARLLPAVPDGNSITSKWVHRAILPDCRIVYLGGFSNQISKIDGELSGWSFVTEPSPEQLSALRGVSKWRATKEVDPMSDEKSCHVMPIGASGLQPMFFYHSREGVSVGIVGADFPGRPQAFRVNTNKAISGVGGLSSGQTQQLAAQIRAGGTKLLISGYEWPHDYPQTAEFSLEGIIQKLDECKAAIRP